MRHFILITAVFVFMLSFSTGLYAQEGGQGTAVTGAPEGKQEGHAHGNAKEKRFVARVDPDGVQRIELTGGDYYFDPNYIVVKVNVPVELKVRKTGFIPHDIVVKAPEAGMDFAVSLDKKPTAITFTPKVAGKYEMFCSKKLPFAKSHRDKGMDGMIEVVP